MAKFKFSTFVRSQFMHLPVTHVDLTGRTVVVIGANVGLGFETVKHFAKMSPAKIVLACRSKAKGEAAVAEIVRETGYTGAELRLVDMARFASVSEFVTGIETDLGRLDILVCNAGVGMFTYEASPEGIELTVQVNHLATSLISILLLPLLLKTAREHGTYSRLVILSSEMHYMADIPRQVQSSPKILDKLSRGGILQVLESVMNDRYPLSKLLNVLFTRALAQHLLPTAPLVVNCVNPGFCLSSFRRNIKFPLSLITGLMEFILARKGEEGARVITYAAVGQDPQGGVNTLKGAYVSDCKVVEESDWVFTKDGTECERRLWDETVDVLSKADSRVKTIVDQYLTGHTAK